MNFKVLLVGDVAKLKKERKCHLESWKILLVSHRRI